jgi:hypothetical protein
MIQDNIASVRHTGVFLPVGPVGTTMGRAGESTKRVLVFKERCGAAANGSRCQV